MLDPSAWEEDPEAADGSLLRPVRDKTEVWFRSPYQYVNVLKRFPVSRFVFTERDLTSRLIDPVALLSPVLPPVDFRWITLRPDHAELQSRSGAEAGASPRRLPLWKHGDPPEDLLKLMFRASREDFDRIVVTNLPRRDRSELARVIAWLYKATCAYPDAKLHVNYVDRFRYQFGLNFLSSDYNPAPDASYDKLRLPNGNQVTPGSLTRNLKWVHVLGFSAGSLRDYEQRVAFNMAAALWAAEHWLDPNAMARKKAKQRSDPLGLFDATKFARNPRKLNLLQNLAATPDEFPQFSPDPDEPYHLALPIKNAPLVPVSPRSKDNGDKIVCDRCSLAPTCRVYRKGAICALTTSSTSKVVEMFGTRDADVVAEALREVLRRRWDRYERASELYRDEDDSDIRDLKRGKHLLDMEDSLTRNVEMLIKIIDPSYRAQSPAPAVAGSVTHIYNPQVLVADLVRELERQGVDRSAIDVAAITRSVAPPSQPQPAGE